MEQKNEKKTNLFAKLEQMNKSANVSKAIKNKYVYPAELSNLKSTDKEKKSYRKKIQKTILYYLSLEKPTKENKTEFNEFCKTFINNFISLDKIEIDNLYSFHEKTQKENANKVLNLYKQIK